MLTAVCDALSDQMGSDLRKDLFPILFFYFSHLADQVC